MVFALGWPAQLPRCPSPVGPCSLPAWLWWVLLPCSLVQELESCSLSMEVTTDAQGAAHSVEVQNGQSC